MYTNLFYQIHINYIGGVETFLYELARLTNSNHRDLTILYKTGDIKQIHRIRKYCRILRYDEIERPIKCKRAFFNYELDIIDEIEAEEYIQIVHADFKDKSLTNYPIKYSPKINKYFAVSNNSKNSYHELTGRDIEVLYNPIQIDEEPRIMTLVSAQRLTNEKGPKRLEKMIQQLDYNNIPYVWHIFSGTKLSIESDNVVYHKPTLDIRKWLKYADYTVLLSDTEGFPYTAYESLCLGTPLIITRLPITEELGCTENNSFIIDFNLSNLDVNKIYEKAGTFNFKYKQKETKWLDLLQGESNYEYKLVPLEATVRYFDIELNREIKVGEIYEAPDYRAKLIVGANYAKYV